jgi:hypothetical protein
VRSNTEGIDFIGRLAPMRALVSVSQLTRCVNMNNPMNAIREVVKNRVNTLNQQNALNVCPRPKAKYSNRDNLRGCDLVIRSLSCGTREGNHLILCYSGLLSNAWGNHIEVLAFAPPPIHLQRTFRRRNFP